MWATIRERAPQIAFGLALLVMGGYGTVGSVDHSRELSRRVETFVASECTITRHEIATGRDSDDDLTYRPVVHYTHVVDGVVHSGQRIGFTSTSSSERSYADDVLASYPVGTRWPCWHDPAAADDVVLDRSTAQVSLFVLIPLAFACFGLALLIHAFRREGPHHATGGPLVLSARREESVDLLLSAGFALPFSLAGVAAIDAAWTNPSFTLTVGALMLGGAALGLDIRFLYGLLRIVGPRPWLRLAAPRVRLGESITLTYSLGRPWLALRGQLALVGFEEVIDLTGTRPPIETHEFHRSTLVEIDRHTRAGAITFTMPRPSRPSSRVEHRHIVWAIAVKAHVRPGLWPDLDEQYEFEVEAAEAAQPS